MKKSWALAAIVSVVIALPAAAAFALPGGSFVAANNGGSPSIRSTSAETKTASTEDEFGRGALSNAEVIARQFEMTTEDVIALHKDGFGFGSIVKISILAKAKGISATELASSLPRVNGKPEASFGELIKGLSEQEKARSQRLPRNLGQAKKAARTN